MKMKAICIGCEQKLQLGETTYCAKCRTKIAAKIDDYHLFQPGTWRQFNLKLRGNPYEISLYADHYSCHYNEFAHSTQLLFGLKSHTIVGTPYTRQYGDFHIMIACFDLSQIETLSEYNSLTHQITVIELKKERRIAKYHEIFNVTNRLTRKITGGC